MYLIPPPQPEYWVLSLSGGKDSTALGLEWLKRHQQDPVTYPLHEVIYCDTGMEFPAMVEHTWMFPLVKSGLWPQKVN